MSAPLLLAVLALAALQGSLVALPKADALGRLRQLRSPVWAAVLPGSILVGTFAPLWQPSLASTMVELAAVATPLLAVVAAGGVVRGRPSLLVVSALALVLGGVLVHGPVGELSSTLVTASGCLALGVALTRLIAPRWLLAGVVLTCLIDVALLALGVGEPSAALLTNATAGFDGPKFDQATIGPVTIDYPDLALAGALGGYVAGRPTQRRAAVALTLLAGAWGTLLCVVPIVPATIPIALTFVLLGSWERRASRRQRRAPLFRAQDGRERSSSPPVEWHMPRQALLGALVS